MLSLLIVVPLVPVYWRLATPRPIPKTALPNPNGYDELVEAGKMLATVAVPDPMMGETHTQLKTFVAQQPRVYDAIAAAPPKAVSSAT